MNTSLFAQAAVQKRKLPLLPIVFAQQCVLFPLYFFIPFWISLISIGCAIIVIWNYYYQSFKISRWFKLTITFVAVAGVLLTFKKLSGRDAGVALICVMYGLKILETHKPRDATILLSLGFFMLVAGFLFTQKPWIAIYQFIPVLAILNGLVAMQMLDHSQANQLSISKILKRFSKYLLLALPIMLILFVFFPRLGGPIWRMPGASSGVSGVSDNMTPGAISSLHLSDKIAFRVTFKQQPPKSSLLYWRVLVLDGFDGLTWSRIGTGVIDDPVRGSVDSEIVANIDTTQVIQNLNYYEYSITLEPTRQNFLVTLDRPVKTPESGRLLEDYATYSPFRILDRTRYSVTSSPEFPLDLTLSASERQKYTALPDDSNLRSLRWAEQQRQLYNSDSEYIRALLRQINQKEYFYTLLPPIMAEDTVDSFWFDHLKGFCEHYASALVFLARAANIPARVVIGYQGGDKNPLSDYWIVRNANAHAWTEVWFEGIGWQRIDPTSAIAPSRIEERLLNGYRQRETLFNDFDFVELDDVGIFKQFEYWSDQFNNRWNDWIIDYNSQLQRQVLANWGFSKINSQQLVIIMILLVMGFVLLTSFNWFRRKQKLDPLAKAFLNLQQVLNKRNIVAFDPVMGPEKLKNCLINQKAAEYQIIISTLDEYIKLRYQLEKPQKQQVKELVKKIRQLH